MAAMKKTRGPTGTDRTFAPARRSPKAPALPAAGPAKGQTRRRQRRATAAVRKDTTILQTDEGPRAAWSAAKPKFPKR